MTWLGRRRLVRRWRDRLESVVAADWGGPLTNESCAGSGQRPMWAKTRTGDCPVCHRTCALAPNPDGGPGAVVVDH